MAIHLAAQLLFLGKQYEASREYYNNLLLNPPCYPVEPESCIDLFPYPIYAYSITLESALV